MSYTKDTIAAQATAPGRGGIGIVRVSGPAVADIAEAVLGELPEDRVATFSKFRDSEGVIDEGIAIYFEAPASFTGEHVLELQGHGGPVVLDMLLKRIVSLGARIASPGEFSQRAFLNDKIDLAQAEAIADLIDSSTAEAARGALRSMQGEFSRKVSDLVAAIIHLRVFVEAAIDFPEEEVDFLADERVEAQLADIVTRLETTLEECSNGALLNDGASVVLMGKPNAGKSSLMNLLTGQDTSIVTDIPGTTRDVVQENLQLDGIPLRLVDTAGLRESVDAIEAEGVRRAKNASEAADLVINVVDASADSDFSRGALATTTDMIVVLNKIDLVDDRKAFASHGVCLSAKTGEGLDDLKKVLKQKLGFNVGSGSTFTARARHVDALERALNSVLAARHRLVEQKAGELVAEELRRSQEALSEITGEFTPDDLLGEIFSNFCIGK